MTPDDVRAMLQAMSAEQLVAALGKATMDLACAAETLHGSEWHEACFAGVMGLYAEFERRGLATPTAILLH